MPIPSPKSGDNQKDFISRCINNSTMKSEYPTAQRIAICYEKWNAKRK